MAEQGFEIPTLEQITGLLGDSPTEKHSLRFRHSNRQRTAVATAFTMTADALAFTAALLSAVGFLGLTGVAEIDTARHLTVLPLIVGIFFVIGAWRGF